MRADPGIGPYTDELPGLAAGPMGNWLAAVGLLRMLSRADRTAALYWSGVVPCIRTSIPDMVVVLADRTLLPFTPAITPWQAGGGWGEKDVTPRQRVTALSQSRSDRLAPMRAAIKAANDVVRRYRDDRTRDERDKAPLVLELRNWLPDDALPWLDACVPLRDKDGGKELAVGHAPMAGTGGNDARWDISTNYHAAILALKPDEYVPEGSGRFGSLADLLAGTENEPLIAGSAGPYWGDATQSGLVNPWALILLAEGLCAFGDSGNLQVFGDRRQPWTTSPGPELAGGESPGECWLPMWGEPMTMPEVRMVLNGDRPVWRGRPAHTPAHMYSSLRVNGWPQGVTGYARYGLAKRRGHGHVAVPLDMVTPANQQVMDELLYAEEAAEAAGITVDTWRAYVSRGHAPEPDIRDQRTGRPQWFASTVSRYLATRPGQGTRTDL